MPARETAPAGAPCWVDLFTSDTVRARDFYCALFGWTAEEPAEEFGGYINFRKDDVRVAGCMSNESDPDMPEVWSVYLNTSDAAKTVEAVRSNGGQVMIPYHPVGDLGGFAVVADPGGAIIGLWEPAKHKGFGLLAEPGAPSWFELHTRDYDASVEFYREVFGWNTHVVMDAPEYRYTVQRDGDDWLAGVHDATLPEGIPAHWVAYFGVEDTDKALATVTELGGSIVEPAEDTEYGRVATVADPTGARFKIVAANEAMPQK